MGENGDLIRANRPGAGPVDGLTSPAAVERRIWRNIFGVIGVALAVAAVLADFRFVLGVALGGGLALFNYRWLAASLREVMAISKVLDSKKSPPGTTLKFIFRWLIIAAIAYAANQTGYFDPIAILAGLFAPALAVMVEAAYITYRTLAHGGE